MEEKISNKRRLHVADSRIGIKKVSILLDNQKDCNFNLLVRQDSKGKNILSIHGPLKSPKSERKNKTEMNQFKVSASVQSRKHKGITSSKISRHRESSVLLKKKHYKIVQSDKLNNNLTIAARQDRSTSLKKVQSVTRMSQNDLNISKMNKLFEMTEVLPFLLRSSRHYKKQNDVKVFNLSKEMSKKASESKIPETKSQNDVSDVPSVIEKPLTSSYKSTTSINEDTAAVFENNIVVEQSKTCNKESSPLSAQSNCSLEDGTMEQYSMDFEVSSSSKAFVPPHICNALKEDLAKGEVTNICIPSFPSEPKNTVCEDVQNCQEECHEECRDICREECHEAPTISNVPISIAVLDCGMANEGCTCKKGRRIITCTAEKRTYYKTIKDGSSSVCPAIDDECPKDYLDVEICIPKSEQDCQTCKYCEQDRSVPNLYAEESEAISANQFNCPPREECEGTGEENIGIRALKKVKEFCRSLERATSMPVKICCSCTTNTKPTILADFSIEASPVVSSRRSQTQSKKKLEVLKKDSLKKLKACAEPKKGVNPLSYLTNLCNFKIALGKKPDTLECACCTALKRELKQCSRCPCKMLQTNLCSKCCTGRFKET